MYPFIISLIAFFVLELLYFKIANHFNIIDKPNQRSSHTQITLRGGGIIFPIAFIVGIFIFQPSQYYVAFGVFAIALISFLDDIITLNNKLRIGIHLLSVLLLLVQLSVNENLVITNLSLVYCILILASVVLILGIINAYNFMDGINGITVLYSLFTIISFLIIQAYLSINILDKEVLYLLLASLLVFGFSNLRKQAKAFAGDVGSISMALIISFSICTLIILTEDIKWILLLGVYGLDAVATIVCRIFRRENIFDAHRSHFYQFLANEKKLSHVIIAVCYASIQLIINASLLFLPPVYVYLFFILLTSMYVIIRLKYEGKYRLFVKYS